MNERDEAPHEALQEDAQVVAEEKTVLMTCPDCGGDGEVDCTECCDGETDCYDCDGADDDCESCGGTGTVSCDECSGGGTVECDRCNGESEIKTTA